MCVLKNLESTYDYYKSGAPNAHYCYTCIIILKTWRRTHFSLTLLQWADHKSLSQPHVNKYSRQNVTRLGPTGR